MTIEPLSTERLLLEPLTVDHAAAMVAVLADPALYEFTGGSPHTLSELSERYARQSAGHSADGSEQWLNWVVVLGDGPIGYVQATVVDDEATIAWVLAPEHQGRGLATEAATAMVRWLVTAGVGQLIAHIHPDHGASGHVAERLGLRRTDVVEDGEARWVRDLGFVPEWQAWHDAREERLRDPHGWLAITAIHWLAPDPERFDDVPGAWSGDGLRATVTLAPGETLGAEGGATLAYGVHTFRSLDAVGLRLTFGDAVAQVAERDGRLVVRPRHPDSPNLRAYRGTRCYPPDPAWVLTGRFERWSEPDGDAVGEVVFEHDGAEHRLVAWGEDDGSLWILFRDATSGVTTYPANRQLDVAPPAPDGVVTIDFNRAINMPCAYTEFATCPLPPPANTLAFAVEAGEQIPATC
ncbi:MAG: uncharacterized protein QOD98_665 [Nocardioidaceae bacterium]|jgi:uncharacterized protein (DUF1684 family)|nr:uncharacterized protein [Nocardioidaceae bacterium]